MNSQGGEGNNNQSPTATPTAVVDRNVTVEPNVEVSSNPLGKLEDVVAAAKLEAAPRTTATGQTPAETPKGQFLDQFGSGHATPATPTTVESAPDLIDTALANVGDTPPAETPQQPEQTPAEKLKQQIADSVNAFLEEVAKEKIAP